MAKLQLSLRSEKHFPWFCLKSLQSLNCPNPQRSAAHGNLCLSNAGNNRTIHILMYLPYQGARAAGRGYVPRLDLWWFKFIQTAMWFLKEVFLLLEHNPEVPVFLWLYMSGCKMHSEALPRLLWAFASAKSRGRVPKVAGFVVRNRQFFLIQTDNKRLSHALQIATLARKDKPV